MDFDFRIRGENEDYEAYMALRIKHDDIGPCANCGSDLTFLSSCQSVVPAWRYHGECLECHYKTAESFLRHRAKEHWKEHVVNPRNLNLESYGAFVAHLWFAEKAERQALIDSRKREWELSWITK